MNETNNFLEMYGKKHNQSEELTNNEIATESLKINNITPKKPLQLEGINKKIGFAFAGIVIISIIIYLFLAAGKKEVVDFSNWTKSDFMLWAQENQITPQTEEQYNDTVDSGKIISQSIIAGNKIKKGDILKVMLSSGPDMTKEFDLPDIMNMTKDEIDSWANDNKMGKVRISSEYSDSVPLGSVIKYEINDDSVVDKVKRSTPIYVIISKGIEDASSVEIKIPDFKTLGVSASVLFAEENGLILNIEDAYDDYVPKTSIISQSIALDEIAHKGDKIKIVVSLGKKKFMPSFSSLTEEQAISKASQLGITPSIIKKYSSLSEGRMIRQSIKEGQLISEDTTLKLEYSLGNKIAITNYTGMQKFELEQWVDKVNQQSAGLKIKTTFTENDLPSGSILQQDKKDIYLDKGTTISIVVSSGKTLFTPDFVARDGAKYDFAITREKAEAMVKDMNIVLVFVEENNPSRLAGEVWCQNVPAGSEIKAGSTITLKYNPVKQTLVVPDFTNKTQAEIQQMAEFNNLHVKFQTGDVQTVGEVVYKQSILSNTTVAYGSEIILYVSPKLGDTTAEAVVEPES